MKLAHLPELVHRKVERLKHVWQLGLIHIVLVHGA